MITRLVERTMNAVEPVPVKDLDDIHRADQAARAEVARLLDGSLVSSTIPDMADSCSTPDSTSH